MQIVKYELSKNNDYNVYLSNGEVLVLDEKIITENELLLKKEIDTGLYNKLNKENDVYKIYTSGIKYISIRLRSIKEIKDYLTRKKYNTENIDLAISNLIKNGYLDDNRFARAYIKDKLMFTNIGDYKLRKDLNNLGVEENIIEDNFQNIDDSIYPLALPTGTKLSTEEKVAKTNGERIILTFEGEKPFLLVEETANVFDEFTIIPTSGDPYMLQDSVGVLGSNSLNWTTGGIEYYIVSDVLNQNELIEIASSISALPTMK